MTDVSPFSQPIQAPVGPSAGGAPVDSLFAGTPTASPSPPGSSPTLDALFGGASPPPKTGPLADLSASVAPMGRILNAFGQGAAHQWGSKPTTPGPVTTALNGIEGGKDVTDQHSGMLKGFNEAFLRPAAAVLDNAIHAYNNIDPSLQAGLQAEAAQLVKEKGPGVVSGLTRSLVNATIPPHHSDITQARAAGAIGEDEASFFGSKPPTPDQLRERAVAQAEVDTGGIVSPLERMNMSLAQYKATGGPLGDVGRALERDFDTIADIRVKKAEAAASGNWLEYAKQSGLEAYARAGSVMDTVFPAVTEPLAQAQSHILPEAGTFQRFVPSTIDAKGRRIPAHTVAAVETPEERAAALEGIANLETSAVPLGWAGKALKTLGGVFKGGKAVEGAEAARATETAPVTEAASEAAQPTPETAPAIPESPATSLKPQPPTIDELARKVDPQTFDQWDSLQLAREQQRAEIARLGEERLTSPEVVAARADLHDALGVEPGVTLSDEALEEHIQAVAQSAGDAQLQRVADAYDRHESLRLDDTPELIAAREKLTEIDTTLGRLGPQVSAAYRHAEDLIPEAEGATGGAEDKEVQNQQSQQVLQAIATRDAEAAAPNVVGNEKLGAPDKGSAEPSATLGGNTPGATTEASTTAQAVKTEPPAGRTGSLRPVEGTGEEKARGTSVSAEAGAIGKGLEGGFGGETPTYLTVEDKAQEAKIATLYAKDKDRAVQIAMGDRAPPADVLVNHVYTYVYNRALAEGDFELAERLANRSKLVAANTTMGQNISALRNLDRGEFLSSVRDLKAALVEKFAGSAKGVPLDTARERVIADDAKALAAEKKAVAPPKADRLSAFIDSIRCA